MKRVSPPQIAETGEEEREKPADEMVLFLKLLDLNGFLFLDLGMNFLFLNEDSMAVETDRLLIRSPQVKPVGRTSAHGAPVQETLRSAIPRHPDEKSQKKEGHEKDPGWDPLKPGFKETVKNPLLSDELVQR